MGNFLAELKRRHIYRVAAAYAVVAWLLIQLVNNISPMLKLPEWIGSAVLVLLAVGFPIALIFAWILHLASADGTRSRAATGKLDWLFIAVLVIVIVLVSYQQLAPTVGARNAQQQTVGASGAAMTGGISIAVLPFTNLSSDKEQEFFSDGMTDEIMTALSKVTALRVVGRKSAFQFKGQKADMHAVGQALRATYLIEGSVRKEGARVRITAQLVQADSGVSLWTNSYDRELTSVFATQEDIAQSIAAALRVPLGLRLGETLVRDRTNDEASYEDYLRAKVLYRSRGYDRVSEAIKLLESVVARDPQFAPAWARLALAYAMLPDYHSAYLNVVVEELRPLADQYLAKAKAAAQRAIQLDPKLPDAYAALAQVSDSSGNYIESIDLYARALASDPGNPDVLHLYSGALAEVGLVKKALPLRQRLQELEPFVPVFAFNNVRIRWIAGEETEELISTLKAVGSLPNDTSNLILARIYAVQGRYQEAADLISKAPSVYLRQRVETAAKTLRTAPAPLSSEQALPPLATFGWTYLFVGHPDQALLVYEDMIRAGYRGIFFSYLWAPVYAPVRKLERFKVLVRNAGMVDYWKARGWPDLCRPIGADDFVCD